jgi:hypothetical protein
MKRRIYIIKIISLNLILLLLFSTIAGSSSLYSQKIHHTNPYFTEISWHFDFVSKNVILDNNIKTLRITEFKENEKGKKIKSSKNVKIIEYNSKGNPTKIETKLDANNNFEPAIGKFNHTKKPLSKDNRVHLITIDYDSLNRISTMIERIPIEGTIGRRVIETNNIYNEYRNLSVQIQKETQFYDKSSKPIIESTTNINTLTFYYSNRDFIKYLIYENHFIDTTQDTSVVEMNIDSLLLSLTFDDYSCQQTKDSLGRIVEKQYKTCENVEEGRKCYETSFDRVLKYIYDQSGHLIFTETYQRNGEFLSRYIYHYDETNLLRSSYYKDSKYITYYNYEFY